jgi:actin related protein 2/3 complex subunit 2
MFNPSLILFSGTIFEFILAQFLLFNCSPFPSPPFQSHHSEWTSNSHLTSHHDIISISDVDYKPAPTEAKLHDFDHALFQVTVLPDCLTTIFISLAIPCYKDIKSKGSEDAVKKAYGNMVQAPFQGFDVTIRLQEADYKGKEEHMIDLVSRLKRIVVGGVFDFHLEKLTNNTTSTLTNFKFDLRKDTTVYFLPSADRISVFFRISFMDKADNEIGRVFLREFADPSLRRKVQRAPIVDFDVQPQLALKAFGVDRASPTDLGFVSFTILPTHCTEALRPKVVESLQIFRNFVQYHLKCAKSYFSSRIRARTTDFLKYLNRAKRNTETNLPKRILTAGGKLKIG